MGVNQSARSKHHIINDGEEVDFDHFQILRAIGKGSFGKVCIVQKKDTKQMYAMKYMNKSQCLEKDAIRNVMKEIEIMTQLDHPFLVNLWFSFQDEEDMFMVSDLLLGGDLRYHIQQDVCFNESAVRFYVCEIALALDYLQSKRILHRDVKPDNILMDEEGHAHLADFNIAAVLDEGQLATSMSGTKPYMAPEIFACAADVVPGYGFSSDWWSLGVCAFELAAGRRPFDIHSNTPIVELRRMLDAGFLCPPDWSDDFIYLLRLLLRSTPSERVSNLESLKKIPFMTSVDMDVILEKKLPTPFTPSKDHLNCDPTFELEEMIIESKPLHKKKKRLAKQRSLREIQVNQQVEVEPDPVQQHLENIAEEFTIYNRQRELHRRELERRENEWEQELWASMMASNPVPNASGAWKKKQTEPVSGFGTRSHYHEAVLRKTHSEPAPGSLGIDRTTTLRKTMSNPEPPPEILSSPPLVKPVEIPRPQPPKNRRTLLRAHTMASFRQSAITIANRRARDDIIETPASRKLHANGSVIISHRTDL